LVPFTQNDKIFIGKETEMNNTDKIQLPKRGAGKLKRRNKK